MLSLTPVSDVLLSIEKAIQKTDGGRRAGETKGDDGGVRLKSDLIKQPAAASEAANDDRLLLHSASDRLKKFAPSPARANERKRKESGKHVLVGCCLRV